MKLFAYNKIWKEKYEPFRNVRVLLSREKSVEKEKRRRNILAL